MKRFSQQKGVALITVMLVLAITVIIATQMASKLRLQTKRSENIELNQQAYWYAMGAEAFGQLVLRKTFDEEPKITHLQQPWAVGEQSFPVDYGQITGEIFDLQACLNINALRETEAQRQQNPNSATSKSAPRLAMERLIGALDIEGVGEFEAESMTDALMDFLDDDSSIISAGGAEDNDYASKEFPYYAANNYLADVNELRVIEHFTVPVINKLKEYVCVIPDSDLHKININTLDADKPEILMALLDVSRSDAESILSARDKEGYSDTKDFFQLKELSKIKLTDTQKDQLVVDSEYFKLRATASFNESYFVLSSVFRVDKNDRLQVISRKIGRE